MRSLLAILMTLFVVAACTEKKTDSDKIVDEFKEAGEKVSETVSDGVDAVKDEACEMIDGKLECAAKEITE